MTRCFPCRVEAGKRVSVSAANTQAPEGATLTYRWTSTAGEFRSPAEWHTEWTAPQEEGPVPVTLTLEDGKGGKVSDSMIIQVLKPGR